MSKKVEMPLRKPANLPYPRLPAPTGPNFKGLSPLLLQYENGSNLVYKQLNAISIDTERPQIFHFKVIGLFTNLDMTMLELENHFWKVKLKDFWNKMGIIQLGGHPTSNLNLASLI